MSPRCCRRGAAYGLGTSQVSPQVCNSRLKTWAHRRCPAVCSFLTCFVCESAPGNTYASECHQTASTVLGRSEPKKKWLPLLVLGKDRLFPGLSKGRPNPGTSWRPALQTLSGAGEPSRYRQTIGTGEAVQDQQPTSTSNVCELGRC